MATRKFISEDNLLYYHAGLKRLFATQSGLTALSNVVNGKADAADTLAGYGITDAMTATAITQAISNAISGKADASTTLSGYGITNAYTKTEADGKFLTSHQDISGKADKATTLAGYGITDSMTSTQINSAIADAVGDITSFEFQIVQTLPASGAKGTMYLVLMGTTETQNYYEEFIYVNNAWEKLGTLGVDLSGYMQTTDMVEATETEIDTILAS